VEYVIDGDTLILRGGTRLRLIGIDTPELGRDGKADAPYAGAARETLHQLIQQSGEQVEILGGKEERDRYGRSLAHVYDASGRNLNEEMLRRGLAYLSIFPPNLRFSDCYRDAELAARQQGRGLWSHPAIEASKLSGRERGFLRIAGQVRSVARRGNGRLILFEGGLELRIREPELVFFDDAALAALQGKRLQVRGWLHRHHGKPAMRIRHPSAFLGMF
jgi:endonuclease YncB( thermonuclease family)